ncbi:hypothetical protein HPB48_007252 [Haemaphysalis longicornis]|uniref:Uncharacterized protein n=1 Tax=Haemaphysalis longicornis TaxID=44386 RepID=A0A9J6FZH0_HAELO|nr:hypothetical protein HPB48_007252 [Haemaphysalis longicornis]
MDDQSLAAYLVLKVSAGSNTLIVSTWDTKQAARLLRMPLHPRRYRLRYHYARDHRCDQGAPGSRHRHVARSHLRLPRE